MLSPESILDDGSTLALGEAFASAKRSALEAIETVEDVAAHPDIVDLGDAVRALVPAEWREFDDALCVPDADDLADFLPPRPTESEADNDYQDLVVYVEVLKAALRALIGAAFALCPDPPARVD